MLYRIDTPSGPVIDLSGRVRLFRSMASARIRARETFERRDEPTTITRIDKSGHLSHALTIDRIR